MDKEIFNKAIQGYVKDQKKYSEPYTVCKDFAGAKARKGFDWSVVVMIDKAASVRAKLKNKAKISGMLSTVFAVVYAGGIYTETFKIWLRRQKI